jgi:glycosyltransferase involved in cell wall biosynthesis
MMVGPFPRTPDRINGGVAAAQMYLSQALVDSGAVELIGIRISKGGVACADAGFNWQMEDLSLGRFSLTTLYRRQLSAMGNAIARFKPDVVHAQGTDVAGYIAVRLFSRTVVTVHGLLAECARYQTRVPERLRAALAAAVTESDTVKRARDLIAVSPYVASYYGPAIGGRVHEIPNPVPQQFFDVERAPIPGRILYAGRIANGKGLEQLLRAFARSRSAGWKLVLAGATTDRDYESTLRKQSAALGLADSVDFKGLLTESALLEEFSSADALVLPSFQETAPMVVQQAMAAAVPVIATRVGGVPHQIEHGVTGFLAAPGDEETLAALLSHVGDQPDRAKAVAEAGRRIAIENYRASVVALKTIAVYRSMLDGPAVMR